MRVPLHVTLFAILLGAVEVAGGAQELICRRNTTPRLAT